MRRSSLGLEGVSLLGQRLCAHSGWLILCSWLSPHTHIQTYTYICNTCRKNVRKSSHAFVPWIIQDWGMLIFCIYWSLINVLASSSLTYIVTSKFIRLNFNICLLIKRICLHLRKSTCCVPQARVFVHVAVESLFIWGSGTFILLLFSFCSWLVACHFLVSFVSSILRGWFQ